MRARYRNKDMQYRSGFKEYEAEVAAETKSVLVLSFSAVISDAQNQLIDKMKLMRDRGMI